MYLIGAKSILVKDAINHGVVKHSFYLSILKIAISCSRLTDCIKPRLVKRGLNTCMLTLPAILSNSAPPAETTRRDPTSSFRINKAFYEMLLTHSTARGVLIRGVGNILDEPPTCSFRTDRFKWSWVQFPE